ncbi:MAG: hypothetical protein GH155_00840 [Spirochaeta sp.]|nr:hypothetical protein [Spirochaeta sp.]
MKARYFCDFCGEEVPANTTRCPRCAKLFTAVKCPKCGYMGKADNFDSGCPSCSYLMDKEDFKPVKETPLLKPWIYRVASFALAALLLLFLFLFIKI